MKIELLHVTPEAQTIIERAARVCYKSESKGEPGALIRKLICSGHESVLEHASAGFIISGVSRACTHQLVRHRLCAFSQESQRYVRASGFEYVIPPSVEELGEAAVTEFQSQMGAIDAAYEKWKALGLRNEDARFILPNACCTTIAMSANFRQWRHILKLRCDKHAQWEIRDLCLKILSYLSALAPDVFYDFKELA